MGSYNVKYEVDENFFENIDTQEKAYTLGLLYADGCVYKNAMIIGVIDKEIVDNVKYFLKYEGPIEIYQKNENCETLYKLRIKRIKIFNDLVNKGCIPAKSLTLKFPPENIVSKNLLGHFIRGWFDGDGCIHYTNRKTRPDNNSWVVQLTGTQEFLDSIVKLYDLSLYKQQVGNKNTWHYRIQKKSEIEKFLRAIYKDEIVSLNRKKAKALECLKKISVKL